MAYSYLNAYRSVIPATQGNQLLKLLISKRDSGEIRTIDEFKDQIKTLTTSLLSSQIAPTFKLIQAIAGEDTSPEQYNYLIDAIYNDLEAAFAEANNLEDILDDHHQIIDTIGLKTLRYTLAELEAKVALYEFLASDTAGHDDALYNTFKEGRVNNTTRSDTAAGAVFFDPRTGSVIEADEDCQQDLVGERLLLGSDTKQQALIQSAIWLSNPESIRGEIDATFKGSNINNLIDGKNNTYWIVPILVSKVRSGGAPLELALSLGASQDINFVEIELATKYPLVCLGIDYLDSTGNRQTAETNPITLYGDTRLNFERVNTNYLILRFRQDNCEELQFQQRQGKDNFYRVLADEPVTKTDLLSVSDSLKNVLSSDFLLTDIFNLPAVPTNQLKYYEYIIGFDNIRAGLDSFNSRGIFSSIKKTIQNPGQVSLKVVETRPVQIAGSTSIVPSLFTYPPRSDIEDDKFYHSVIEYWLMVQSRDVNGILIGSDFLPVFPLGATRVYHEQLVFKAYTSPTIPYPDISQLMFYTLASTIAPMDVVLYRNGTKLTNDVDWDFVTPMDATTLPPNQTWIYPGLPNGPMNFPGLSRMKRAVKVFARTSPLDIYTASYTPFISNTKQVQMLNPGLNLVVDLTTDQFARLTQGNIITFGTTHYSLPVASADCYLIILMRRNSAEVNFSPSVEEYLLATGTRDQNKFTGG